MTLLRLAWRNLGRNRRRTALTAGGAAFAAVLTIYTLAAARGSHERWIDEAVRLYPGHLEVSLRGYREYRTLDYTMTLAAEARAGLESLPGSRGWVPRLEAWALAIPDTDQALGRAAWLVGLDAPREAALSTLLDSVHDGSLQPGRPAQVVLGSELARSLRVARGDRIILIAPDYYGSQSADRFEVAGVLTVGNREFDGYAALVDLAALQEFLEVGEGISHVAVFASDSRALGALSAQVGGFFPSADYEVVDWMSLIPDVVQFMVLDDLGAWLTLAVLIVVVGFGLHNTVLMAVFERMREFGAMRALGVRPRALFWLVMLESMLLAAVGVAFGLLLSTPALLWLEHHPIPLTGNYTEVMELFQLEPRLVFDLTPGQLGATALAVLVTALLAALPPAVRAARVRPIDALRELE